MKCFRLGDLFGAAIKDRRPGIGLWAEGLAQGLRARRCCCCVAVMVVGGLCVVPDVSAQIRTHISADQLGDLLQKAQSGNPRAQLELARVLNSGAVARKDEVAAARWACEAAEQGSVDAQLLLSLLYGHLDVRWYSKSAEKYVFPNGGVRSISDEWLVEPANVAAIPLNVKDALFWISLASRRLPTWNPEGLDKKQRKLWNSEKDSYVFGEDLAGLPLTLEVRRKVALVRDELAKTTDYQTIVGVQELTGQWQPNSVRPWIPSRKCQSSPSSADASTAIDRIRSKQYLPLPPPKTIEPQGDSSRAVLILENGSGYEIVVFLRGSMDSAVILDPKSSKTVELSPGRYGIGVEIPTAAFMPFYGEQDLKGGTSYREAFSVQ